MSSPDTIFTPARRVDEFLDAFLRAQPLPDNLRDAVLYAALGPGKRLRPVLAWHACEALGSPGPASLPAAAALELVHAFSLVHDDLPALDNDDLRRGRPTLHKHTSEPMAILAGDCLLTLAFECLARQAPPALVAPLVAELSAATTAMIVGQVYDTLGGFPTGTPAPDRVRTIHANKTGALIHAACRMGALSASAPPNALDSITRYAQALGLMFQIVDDLLDVEQSPDHTGKATGKDAALGKLTYPGVFGVAHSRSEIARLAQSAKVAAQDFAPSHRTLIALVDYLSSRTR